MCSCSKVFINMSLYLFHGTNESDERLENDSGFILKNALRNYSLINHFKSKSKGEFFQMLL